MDLPWAAGRGLSRCFADCSRIMRSRSDSVATGAMVKFGGRGKLLWRRWRIHADVSSRELRFISPICANMVFFRILPIVHSRVEHNIGQPWHGCDRNLLYITNGIPLARQVHKNALLCVQRFSCKTVACPSCPPEPPPSITTAELFRLVAPALYELDEESAAARYRYTSLGTQPSEPDNSD
jgi:hypothetical protein